MLIELLLLSIKMVKYPEYDEIINSKYSSFTEKADSYLKEQNFQGTVLVSKGKKIIFVGRADAARDLRERADIIYEGT